MSLGVVAAVTVVNDPLCLCRVAYSRRRSNEGSSAKHGGHRRRKQRADIELADIGSDPGTHTLRSARHADARSGLAAFLLVLRENGCRQFFRIARRGFLSAAQNLASKRRHVT